MNLDSFARATAAPHRPRDARLAWPHGRTVDAGHALAWLADGFDAARAQPVLWLGAILLGADIATLASLAPVLWPLAAFAAPLLLGAVFHARQCGLERAPAGLRSIAAALAAHRNALAGLGACSVAIAAVVHFVLLAVVHELRASAALPAWDAAAWHGANAGIDVLAGIATAAAVAFAPALVMFAGASPLRALAASTAAVARNPRLALAALGACAALAMLAAALPPLVCALALTPVVAAAALLPLHAAWRDIFLPR